MIFKDRKCAGKKLALVLKNAPDIKNHHNNLVVVSLLRGGIIIGDQISKILNIPHLPLIVTKISAPYNAELAIGALCFDLVYLEKIVIDSLKLERGEITYQIQLAKEKQQAYINKFHLQKINYQKELKNRIVILTDDGIATGSTIKTALLYIKSQKTKEVILASPTAPFDFHTSGFDKVIILSQDINFSSVSQYYLHFPQVEDDEVKKIISNI